MNDTALGISSTLSPDPSHVAMLDEEAPNVVGYTSTPVLPFIDERAVRALLQDPVTDRLTSVEGQDGSAHICAADIADDTSGVNDVTQSRRAPLLGAVP